MVIDGRDSLERRKSIAAVSCRVDRVFEEDFYGVLEVPAVLAADDIAVLACDLGLASISAAVLPLGKVRFEQHLLPGHYQLSSLGQPSSSFHLPSHLEDRSEVLFCKTAPRPANRPCVPIQHQHHAPA